MLEVQHTVDKHEEGVLTKGHLASKGACLIFSSQHINRVGLSLGKEKGKKERTFIIITYWPSN